MVVATKRLARRADTSGSALRPVTSLSAVSLALVAPIDWRFSCFITSRRAVGSSRPGAPSRFVGGRLLPARARASIVRASRSLSVTTAIRVLRLTMPSTTRRRSVRCSSARDFDVTLKTDVGRDALRQAAMEFGGHGARQRGKGSVLLLCRAWRPDELAHFLIPVDERIETATDLPAQCLELQGCSTTCPKRKRQIFVLILDACRDNPFGTGFQPAQKGLSQFDAPAGSLLAFSTSPGSVAVDSRPGSERRQRALHRAPWSASFRSKVAVSEDGAEARAACGACRVERGAVPWESTSLESDVFLFPTTRSKLTEAEPSRTPGRDRSLNRIKASKQPEDWVAYLRDYPSGKFNRGRSEPA